MAESKDTNTTWQGGIQTEWVAFLLFLSALALVYIYLAHRTDNMVRDIEKTKKELVELRAEHITLKSEIIQKSTRTHVAERLQSRQVGEPDKAVIKIEKRDGER